MNPDTDGVGSDGDGMIDISVHTGDPFDVADREGITWDSIFDH